MKNTGTRGFTVLEIMVALAIVGLLVTLAATNYGQWATQTRLRTATEELTANLNLARMAAISRNRSVLVSFDPLSPSGIGSYRATTEGGITIVGSTTPPSGVHLEGSTPFVITFNALGLSSGGTVQLKARHGTQHRVTITTGGLISDATL